MTSHTPAGVPEPLRDHAEVVRFPGYADGEKRAIAERHLVPRQLRACGLDADAFRAEPGVLDAIVRGWTREAGVRELERRVGRIARRLARRRSERGGESDADAGVVRVAALADWLGPRPFGDDAPSGDDAVGVATGLAHTAAGGEVIQVEVTALPGRGRVQLTGALGEVMRESAGAAIGCVRARAESLGVDPDFPRTRDLHVHVPTAGTPKEGPSAGLAFAAALVSALTGVPLRGDVAMTGEITLRGRVLYVGGVREKAAAAARHRIAHVVLPRACADALGALPRALGDGVCWHPVASLDEALAVALRRRVT